MDFVYTAHLLLNWLLTKDDIFGNLDLLLWPVPLWRGGYCGECKILKIMYGLFVGIKKL